MQLLVRSKIFHKPDFHELLPQRISIEVRYTSHSLRYRLGMNHLFPCEICFFAVPKSHRTPPDGTDRQFLLFLKMYRDLSERRKTAQNASLKLLKKSSKINASHFFPTQNNWGVSLQRIMP